MTSKELVPLYQCRLRYAWRGYCDWFQERLNGPALGEPFPGQSSRRGPGTVAYALIVIVVLVLLCSMALPKVAPGTVSLLGATGPQALADLSIAAVACAAAVMFIGIPTIAIIRFNRFTRMCCRRGYELENGLRESVINRLRRQA